MRVLRSSLCSPVLMPADPAVAATRALRRTLFAFPRQPPFSLSSPPATHRVHSNQEKLHASDHRSVSNADVRRGLAP
jgi:hypothetical protein